MLSSTALSSLDELSSIEEYDYYISSFINSERVIVPPTKIKTKKNLIVMILLDY
jgi:hypothetical protein